MVRSECMNGFVKDYSSRWVHSQCFRGYERAVSDGKLYAYISSFHRWAFSGPRCSNDSKPSHEYGCELTQFLSFPCEAQHASRKCMENAIDSRLQNQQLLLIM